MSELKFDEVIMDTKLAEDFLKSNKSFSPLRFEAAEDFALDNFKNKIFYSKTDKLQKSDTNDLTPVLLQHLFTKLTQKVKENEKLFSQLEYLIRQISPKHVFHCDLKLINQNFTYLRSSEFSKKNFRSSDSDGITITVTDNEPLAVLGYVAQALVLCNSVIIQATKQVAAVSWLFTKLCHEIGLENNVAWTLIKNEEIKDQFHHVQAFQNGCCGVVTGISDVDSAVESFLETPDQFPWRLKRILVQECIIKRFLRALEGKTKCSDHINPDIKTKCSTVYSYEKKLFLFEYVGIDDVSNGVVIEAYRTVKELFSLLDSYKPFCLSLWSSEVSESHEIATNDISNVVWINDYGYFGGQPQTSQSFFCLMDKLCFNSEKRKWKTASFELKKTQEAWLKLGVAERVDKIKNIFSFSDSISFIQYSDDFDFKSFYDVQKNHVCYGHQLLSNYVYQYNGSLEHIRYLLQGFMFQGTTANVCKLAEMGAPIACVDDKNNEASEEPVFITRTIWTTFGTIFAN